MSTENFKTRLAVDLLVAQHIHRLARLERVTVGEIVRRAIEAYVKKTGSAERPTSRRAVRVRTRPAQSSKP